MSRGGGSARPGGIYHLISRFVAKQWFVATDVERRGYEWLLGQWLPTADWRCFAYAVMSSHIHLGVVAGNAPLVDWIGPMHSDFAKWINGRLERIGAVFVRGPDVVEFRPEGTPALIDYIHNNPVRAGVVAHPRDSDWSSHQAYCGLANKPRWLDIELGLQLSGFRDGKELEAWMEVKRTRREELDTFRVTPRRPRGRPSKREELHDRLLSASAENDESTESSVESKVDKAA